MKVLLLGLSVLVALVASKSVKVKDKIDLGNNIGYGYLKNIGVPLANKIRKAEKQSTVYNVNRKFVRPTLRIVEGAAARLGNIPYQAGLIGHLTIGESVCGGSLLNAKRVLTAAHCWWDGEYKVSNFTVVLGSLKLFSGGTRIKTSKVIPHNEWDPKTLNNDIAMIYLPCTVKFSNTIKPIHLPKGKLLLQSFDGDIATASGYGHTRDNDNLTPALRFVDLPVISNDICRFAFPQIKNWPNKICSMDEKTKNTCRGDSGGPLVLIRKNKTILIGVNSFGTISCNVGQPTLYSRVTYYIQWIKNNL